MLKTTGGLRSYGCGLRGGKRAQGSLPTGTTLVRVASAGIQPVRLFNDASASQKPPMGPLILKHTHLLYILELTPKHKVRAFIMQTGSV